ncbi:MAG: 1-acyl-sn-glycerol-3-phosphate acyltransferase [Bacteroidales bacterium]|nr:1-acyl-sn-glycerol-3-phosphate acyltransferase [Bacteroidales bacterium]
MQDITKSSLRYTLLYRLVKIFFKLFYRRFTITGRENIPAGVPVIFASNHQNALMDALAMLFAANRPVVFLARADIFKNARMAKLLNFLKIFPVYRIRDGIETMGNNSLIFDKTVQVLQSGVPLGILPEGTHTDIKHLQTLKKGICRIAFQAAETSGFRINIHIVPVGIDYAHYQNAGTHLLLNYGTPVEVGAYHELYNENPQKAIARLRDDLALAIKKVMIHVENVDFYRPIIALSEILTPNYLKDKGLNDNRIARFNTSQELIREIETAALENRLDLPLLLEQTNNYQKLLDKYKLKNKLFESPAQTGLMLVLSAMLSLVLLPVHLYGMIFNYLPYKLPVLLTRKVKDPQFVSSVNFGLGFVTFVFWYLILLVILLVFTGSGLIALCIYISMPFTGLFTFYHYKHLKKLGGKFRLFFLKHRQPEQYKNLIEARQKLVELQDLLPKN